MLFNRDLNTSQSIPLSLSISCSAWSMRELASSMVTGPTRGIPGQSSIPYILSSTLVRTAAPTGSFTQSQPKEPSSSNIGYSFSSIRNNFSAKIQSYFQNSKLSANFFQCPLVFFLDDGPEVEADTLAIVEKFLQLVFSYFKSYFTSIFCPLVIYRPLVGCSTMRPRRS